MLTYLLLNQALEGQVKIRTIADQFVVFARCSYFFTRSMGQWQSYRLPMSYRQSYLNRSKDEYPQQKFERFDLDSWNDEQCWSHFRFKKDDIYRLKEALRILDTVRTYNCIKFDGDLCIFLHRFAYRMKMVRNPDQEVKIRIEILFHSQMRQEVFNHIWFSCLEGRFKNQICKQSRNRTLFPNSREREILLAIVFGQNMHSVSPLISHSLTEKDL